MQAGFETGDIAAAGASSTYRGSTSATLPTTPAVVSATPTARSGSYSLKCFGDSNGTGWTSQLYSRQSFTHASLTEAWYAFAVYRQNGNDVTTSLPGDIIFENFDTAGNCNLVLTCESDGSVRLYYGNAGTGIPTGTGQFTLIGTSTVNVPLATWTLIEVHFVAATGATGTAEVYVAGSLGYSNTATRTCQLNANSGSFCLEFHKNNATQAETTGTGVYIAFDDLRVNSTAGTVNNGRPHDGSIVLMKPSGAGTHTGLTGTGGATNWQDVSNIPANHADFVSGSAGAYDAYATTGAPTVSTVEALEYIAQAQGGANIEPTFYTQLTLSQQTAQPTQASWGYVTQTLETNPVSAAAWTQTDLNNLQIGVTCP